MERVDYESMIVQEIFNSYDREELDISPWYQRRAVWTNAHKSYLVNSVFETMPVPTIYIRHTLDLEQEKTIKEIVDGQQRVRSLLDYRANEFSARHPEHARKVYYKSLTAAQRREFLMSKLPVAYLIEADDSDVIEIFGRLNAVSKPLNAQEKRAAVHSGEFHQFCLRQAVDRLSIWRDLRIFTATEISRMAEVQFVAELAIALVAGEPQDFSAPRIDAAYRVWDEEFPERDVIAKKFERIFEAIAALPVESIKDTIFSRSPVFYSLFLVLNDLERLPSKAKLERAIAEIDQRFNDDRPTSQRPTEDVAFEAAVTSTTQRIRARTVRSEYIRSFM